MSKQIPLEQVPQPSPGELLRAAREASGLTIEQVAAQIHLSRNVIENIEQDDYRRLTAVVYSRGYVRSYAKVVAADEASVLEAFDALGLGVAEGGVSSISYTSNRPSLISLLRQPSSLMSAFIVIVAILLLISWSVDRAKHHFSKASEVPVTHGHASLSLPNQTPSAVTKEPVVHSVQKTSSSNTVEQKTLALKPNYTVTQKD